MLAVAERFSRARWDTGARQPHGDARSVTGVIPRVETTTVLRKPWPRSQVQTATRPPRWRDLTERRNITTAVITTLVLVGNNGGPTSGRARVGRGDKGPERRRRENRRKSTKNNLRCRANVSRARGVWSSAKSKKSLN